MPEDITLTAPADDTSTAPEGTGAPAAEDPYAKVIEDYRKRQAGAEAARQAAVRENERLQAELAALRNPQSNSSKDPDVNAIKRELQEQYERQLATEVARVQAAALDSAYPKARARFPEVTDAAKLAELEVLFGEPKLPETPKPVGNSPVRTTGSGEPDLESMTSKELQAYMKTLPRSVMGLRD